MQNYRLKLLFVILTVIFLILVPLRIGADAFNQQSMSQQEWLSTIDALENKYAQNPANQKVINDLSNAYNNYGVTLAQKNQWDDAEKYMERALVVNPNSTTIKANLSNVYAEHGLQLYQAPEDKTYSSYNHALAKQLATKALSVNDKNVNAYILLGDIEYYNQSMSAAKNAWQQAALLAPENQQIQKRLVSIAREAQAESTMDTKFNMYFIIKIDPGVEALAPGFDINQALDDARIKIGTDFNFTATNKVPVIVYTSSGYHDTISDAPDWSGGAFDGKIRLIISHAKNNIAELKSTIIHEYTHAVIAELTNNHCPRWLNEGIAKYEEYKHGIPPRITYLALAFNTNEFIPWDRIDQDIVARDRNRVILAYQQVYSFVYYIVERYGMYKLVVLLRTLADEPDLNVAFQQVYDAPLATVQANWRIWLNEYIPRWAEQPVVPVE